MTVSVCALFFLIIETVDESMCFKTDYQISNFRVLDVVQQYAIHYCTTCMGAHMNWRLK